MSFHFPLMSKYFPQYPVLKHFPAYVLHSLWETKFHTQTENRQHYISVQFNLNIFWQQMGNKNGSQKSGKKHSWVKYVVNIFTNKTLTVILAPTFLKLPHFQLSSGLSYFVIFPCILFTRHVQWYLGQRVTLLTNFSANDFFRCFSDSANEYGFG